MYMYQKYPWKTEFNFLLAFENQNKLVRCSIFNGYSSFIPGNQMTQWFFEMLWVWQNFQLLMTVKYLPSGWPSFVEVGDRPSWLSWWAKAALCCCKSSSWLCFSSLISFYDTNIHTNLLRSHLKRGNKFSTRDEYLKQRSLRIFILIWIHFLPCQQVYTILLNSYWMINIHESAEYSSFTKYSWGTSYLPLLQHLTVLPGDGVDLKLRWLSLLFQLMVESFETFILQWNKSKSNLPSQSQITKLVIMTLAFALSFHWSQKHLRLLIFKEEDFSSFFHPL